MAVAILYAAAAVLCCILVQRMAASCGTCAKAFYLFVTGIHDSRLHLLIIVMKIGIAQLL